MLETPHVIVGAAIATKVVNPALAIPLALLSHFVLDKVPHWNPHLTTEIEKFNQVSTRSRNIVIIDTTISFLLGVLIASRVLPDFARFTTIIAASFISVLPDVAEGPYFFLNIRSKLIKQWIIFQRSIQGNISVIPGIITQLTIILVSLWWILN